MKGKPRGELWPFTETSVRRSRRLFTETTTRSRARRARRYAAALLVLAIAAFLLWASAGAIGS